MKIHKYCTIFLLFTLTNGSLKHAYESLQWGKRLIGRLLTTIAQVSPLDCAEECLVRPGCLSFNYRRAAIFCELNYENDTSSDTGLTTEDGWIFGRRESWPMELTEECQQRRCEINEKCVLKPLHNADCEIAHCHPLNLILPKHVRNFSSDIAVDFGSKHKLSCLDKFNQTGDGIVSCLWNGTWSDVNIMCHSHNHFEKCFYTYIENKGSWYNSKRMCEQQNGYLLEINSKEEFHFIKQEFIDKNLLSFIAWIGGHKQNDHWTWNYSSNIVNSTELDLMLKPTHAYKEISAEPGDCLLINKQFVSEYKCSYQSNAMCEFDECINNNP